MYLNCHSYFSFKYGTMSIQQLVKEAQSKGLETFALTDINCTAGVFPFLQEMKNKQMHPVIGIDFRNGTKQQYIGLARNHHGFFALNKHLSFYKKKKIPFSNRAPEWAHCAVIYPFSQSPFPLREGEYLGLAPSQIKKALHSEWKNQKEKWVLLQPVTFCSQLSFNIHRLLRCMDLNILLSKLPLSEQGHITDRFSSKKELLELCKEEEWLIQNTMDLLYRCNFHQDYRPVENRKEILGSETEDYRKLRGETFKGALKRYGQLSETQTQRINKELDIIQQKSFVSYFLINFDIVNYARKKGYYYVGRGSGANSLVAYCLYITDVDPLELDLYFERFINLYRKNPPDFDIDFSWKDRDNVIEYIFNKYNSPENEYVCLLATHTTFQMNLAIRELGKVFGMPKTDIEALIQYAVRPGNYSPDNIGKLVLKYSQLIQGMPSHLSIHAGGILISQHPIHYYTATEIPPKGYPISHFDMVVAEDIGFSKFDILSQRGLGHIKDTLDIIQENRGETIDIHQVSTFKKDPKIKEHLRKGRTIGAFYVESPAMRVLLAKLKTQEYLELVAASSIIRPGVARSGMMREYVFRHHTPSERKKRANPVLYELMPETYGIMVYQEDVIKVAHHFAGLSFDEADILRRGMSGKFRSKEEFERVKESFFKKSKAKGRGDNITKEVWHQIESFAGYSFAKGHSASFAVESYQSLFLKAHYPLEFMVGVINNFGGFYRTEFYIHELRMNGADIQPPHINESNYLTRIVGKTVYLGFIHLKYLHKEIAEAILHQRELEGPFSSINDLISRVHISLEQLLILIRIGAFRFLPKGKQALLWEAHFLLHKQNNKKPSPQLFHQVQYKDLKIPTLEQNDPREDILDQLDILEFPLAPPFLLLKNPDTPTIKARDFKKFKNRQVQIMGYLVTAKFTRTIRKETMIFGTFLDKDGDWIDTVHFPPIVKTHPLTGKGVYLLKGKITEEFDVYSLEVNFCERMTYWNAAAS